MFNKEVAIQEVVYCTKETVCIDGICPKGNLEFLRIGNACDNVVKELRLLICFFCPKRAIGLPELLDHSFGNQGGVVRDVALSYREHAVDRQEPVGVDAHPVS